MEDMTGSEGSIVYTSCTEGGFEVLRNLLAGGVHIDLIVSLTREQAEDNRVAGYYPFDGIAEDQDIPVYYPETYGMGKDDIVYFEDLDADLMIVNGWQRLIPGEVLRTLTRGALGVHGSTYGLPEGRGRSPMNWSLIEDLNRFLLSVIKLDEGVDSGKIVDTRKFDITEFDTIRTLYYKLVVVTTDILDESLGTVLSGDATLTAQTGEPTYYPKRNPEDGGINWRDPTQSIYNLVRAVTRPYPGAFTRYDGERIFVWEAIPFSDDMEFDAEPGTITQRFVTTGDFVVKTADGTLLVRNWQAEGWTPQEGIVLESVGDADRIDQPRDE